MAHYEDLAKCDYFPGDTTSLLAVGWLENGRPFRTGAAPAGFLARLKELCRKPWEPVALAGPHACDLCPSGRTMGASNVFVPGESVVFVAPTMIVHYIEVHGYRPPDSFVNAVMECPSMGAAQYVAAVARHYDPAAPSAASRRVFEGLEPVRKRAGMYIGSTDSRGLETMVFEVIGNSLDEHLAGHATRLEVNVHPDGEITVEDDGRGIPVELEPEGKSMLELSFTTLHVGATIDGHHPHVHVTQNLRGVGVGVVSALCSRVDIESRRDGVAFHAAFERGVMVVPVTRGAPTNARGTRIRFRPDVEIFKTARLNPDRLVPQFVELGSLCSRLDLRLQGRSYAQPRGLRGWVEALAGPSLVPESMTEIVDKVDDVEIDIALGWVPGGMEPEVHSFVNYARTQSGSHTTGLMAGLAPSLSAAEAKEALRGLVAVVHVGLLDPRWEGPTRAVLEVAAARTAVERATSRALVANGAWWRRQILH